MVIFHKLQYHESVDRLSQTAEYYETEDRIHNPDNEFEYKIVTKVEIQRLSRMKQSIKEEDEIKYAADDPQIPEPYPIDSIDSDPTCVSLSPPPAPIVWPIKCELIAADPFEVAVEEPTPKRQFQCVYCKNMYKNQSSVRSHMFYAHRNTVPESPQPDKELPEERKSRKVGRPSTINDHRIFKCRHCDVVFANRSKYSKHVLTLRNGKPFFCRTCITGFDFRGDLIQHKRQNRDCKSPPRDKKYLCTYCGKYFEKKDSLVIFFYN